MKLFSFTVCNVHLTCWWSVACREWIPDVSRIASTNGAMVLDRTPRMHPADSGAGILALVLNTCQMLGTFRVNGTFRFTLYVGVSLQPGVRLVAEQQDDWGDCEEEGKEDRLGPKAFLYEEEDVESDEESLAGGQGGQDNWGEVYFTEDDPDSSEALGSISIF